MKYAPLFDGRAKVVIFDLCPMTATGRKEASRMKRSCLVNSLCRFWAWIFAAPANYWPSIFYEVKFILFVKIALS
ncbi:MAG TPA: hypothetical protein ENJ95_20765 [Bacteroidetes bacterium]|nr:hypothetical protein [Bacteroidota bacterium]